MKNKFIVWGIPLHTHTHSYVHHAFARAASYMGFEVAWVNDEDDSNRVLCDNAVVLCCGVSDKHLRYSKGTRYVLHNSSREDLRQGSYINLQVYSRDVSMRNVSPVAPDEMAFWEETTRTLYQPWATDLLPAEIEKISPSIKKEEPDRISWVGSITQGDQGNYEEILGYADVCSGNRIEFIHSRLTSVEQNIALIRAGRHAPTIQGRWQVDNGYIPCRLFKNISYGSWTETNSPTSAALVGIEASNTMEELFEASEIFFRSPSASRIAEKMSLVRDKHTYVNRINNILNCISR